MTGKKRGIKARTSYFIGSEKKGLKKSSQNVVGKIASNFVGTEFHCYTTGKNPKKTKSVDQIREEVAVVRYVSLRAIIYPGFGTISFEQCVMLRLKLNLSNLSEFFFLTFLD